MRLSRLTDVYRLNRATDNHEYILKLPGLTLESISTVPPVIISSPSKPIHYGPTFDLLSSHLHNRIIELFGDADSYLRVGASQEFSKAVGTAFSTTIPQIAACVCLSFKF